VVIDRNEEVVNRDYQEYGAVSVHGEATDADVLEGAGLESLAYRII